nr:glycosyltransferase [Vibrio alfacsensis]
MILFIAIGADDDKNKGFSDVIFVAENISEQVELKIVGSGRVGKEKIGNANVEYMGYLGDASAIIAEYNRADCVIIPSKQESFGQVASESLSCGTPVVCYNTSGLKDIVLHGVNGYLANDFDRKDLLQGVLEVLSGKFIEKEKCRETITKNFSYEKYQVNTRIYTIMSSAESSKSYLVLLIFASLSCHNVF